jgi:hypothetical protein
LNNIERYGALKIYLVGAELKSLQQGVYIDKSVFQVRVSMENIRL